MIEIEFWKYQGCGNDFLIMKEYEDIDYCSLAKKMCERHFGIGADGLLLVKKNPLSMRIINSDGTEATMCGNGIRCFIKFCKEQLLLQEKDYCIKTKAGLMYGKIADNKDSWVQINMGKPSFHHDKTGVKNQIEIRNYSFYMNFHIYIITTLFIGTIHTVIIVSDIDEKRCLKIGHQLHKQPFFTNQTNVNFVEIIDRDTIKVRTYEKGAGLTLACGTGACAAAYCAYQDGLCNSCMKVLLAKGELNIEIAGQSVLMSGPAKYIGKGRYLWEGENDGC